MSDLGDGECSRVSVSVHPVFSRCLGGDESGSSSDSESADVGAYSSDASTLGYGEDPADFSSESDDNADPGYWSSESDNDAGVGDPDYSDNDVDPVVDDRMDDFDFRGQLDAMEDTVMCGGCSDVSDDDLWPGE